MHRPSRPIVACCLGWACVLGAAASIAAPPYADSHGAARRLDRVELRDGRQYYGLVEWEGESRIDLAQLVRHPGTPSYLLVRNLDRAQIAAINRTSAAERAEFQQEIEKFVHHARIEAARMDAVRLRSTRTDGSEHFLYSGDWFSLDSSLDELTTRRIIVRVEQVFTAYRQLLPPRSRPEHPPHLAIFGSLEAYHAFLGRLPLNIGNRACFLPKQNLLAAWSELSQYRSQMERIAAEHAKLRGELKDLEKRGQTRLHEFAMQLQQAGKSRSEIKALLNLEKQKLNRPIQDKKKEIEVCERQNAQVVEKAVGGMFARLYHEAFHAYLENFVYPHDKYDVPYWLNEGLAVIVEGGILEGDTLRIDAPAPDVLKRLKQELAGPHPLALRELLAADQSAFITTGHEQAGSSQRAYATAWGLAYYLTFEKDLLSGRRLDAYVQKSAAGQSPVRRFETLVGMPLGEFEAAWRAYIRKNAEVGTRNAGR